MWHNSQRVTLVLVPPQLLCNPSFHSLCPFSLLTPLAVDLFAVTVCDVEYYIDQYYRPQSSC
jgi:hypothetical protein